MSKQLWLNAKTLLKYVEVFPHKNDCKENVTKKASLCLLEIEKRGDALRVNSGDVTTKRGLDYDKLLV